MSYDRVLEIISKVHKALAFNDGRGLRKELAEAAELVRAHMAALDAYEAFHERIFCTGRPLMQDGKRINHSDLNHAHELAYALRRGRQPDPDEPIGYFIRNLDTNRALTGHPAYFGKPTAPEGYEVVAVYERQPLTPD